MSLSSSEAEWIALSEAVKEILFVSQLMDKLGLNVKKPIKVFVDNMGAVFMSKNTTQTKRTKHIDVRTSFIYEHVNETGTCEVVFVRSEDNFSDIFTKNVSCDINKKLTPYLGIKEDINE